MLEEQMYIFTAIILILINVAYDKITILHNTLFSYVSLFLVLISLSVWENQQGIVILLLLLYFQSIKFTRFPNHNITYAKVGSTDETTQNQKI
jgi:hypothetical protein